MGNLLEEPTVHGDFLQVHLPELWTPTVCLSCVLSHRPTVGAISALPYGIPSGLFPG